MLDFQTLPGFRKTYPGILNRDTFVELKIGGSSGYLVYTFTPFHKFSDTQGTITPKKIYNIKLCFSAIEYL